MFDSFFTKHLHTLNSGFSTFLETSFPQVSILGISGFLILRRKNATKGLQDFSEKFRSSKFLE